MFAFMTQVSIYREYSGTVNSIETSNGQRLELQLSHMGYLQTISVSKNSLVFTYDGSNGLMTSRSSSSGENYFYAYDENGRLNKVTKPTGKVNIIFINTYHSCLKLTLILLSYWTMFF